MNENDQERWRDRDEHWREDPITRLTGQMDRVEKDVSSIKHSLETAYVTVDQFEPVRKVVYGLVTIVLLGFVGALVSLVLIRR
jgi:hypothetical protein